MKSLFLFLVFTLSLPAFAALPIFHYSWSNKTSSSQLMVFEDGTILHQEREQYQNQKILEAKLSALEVEGLKTIVKNILAAEVMTDDFASHESERMGTIELMTPKGMKIVEGFVRDSSDAYHSLSYKSDGVAIKKLKAFIFQYSKNDMDI